MADTYKLSNGQSIWLSRFTGTVVDLNKWSETHVSGGGGGGYVGHGGGYVRNAPVQSHITTKTDFFLKDKDGKERDFKLVADVPLRKDHEVTITWGAASGIERGSYLYLINHTTGRSDRLSIERRSALLKGIGISPVFMNSALNSSLEQEVLAIAASPTHDEAQIALAVIQARPARRSVLEQIFAWLIKAVGIAVPVSFVLAIVTQPIWNRQEVPIEYNIPAPVNAVASAARPITQPPSAPKDPNTDLYGTWEGLASCGGKTAFTEALTVSSKSAVMYFKSLPTNPQPQEGCYTVTGNLDHANGRIDVNPVKWLAHSNNVKAMPGYSGNFRSNLISLQLKQSDCMVQLEKRQPTIGIPQVCQIN